MDVIFNGVGTTAGTACLGRNGVNIDSVTAVEAGAGIGRVEIVTGLSREGQVLKAVREADRIAGVRSKGRLLRFERGLVG